MSSAPQEVAASVPRKAVFIAMMGALMAVPALSIDIILPALPQLREDLGVINANSQQSVITVFMLGFAVGQLFYGPVSDWLGRRQVLLAALVLYVIASVACIAAGTFETLLVARFIQGLGAAGARIVGLAVVRDSYSGRHMSQIMSVVMAVFMLVPIIAPFLGTTILVFGGWHLIIWVMILLSGGLLVWMWADLPETHPEDKREPLSMSWIGQAIVEILRSRLTVGYSLASAVLFGAMMGYVSSAQQIFVEVFDLGNLFPIAFACVAVGLLLASWVNGRYVERVGMRLMSHTAVAGYVVSSLTAVIAAMTFDLPVAMFVFLMSCNLFFFGLMMPNFNAMSMDPMGRIAGTASSFIGAVTTGIGAVLGWLIGGFYNGTELPLLVGTFIMSLLCFGITLYAEKGRMFNATPQGT